MTRKYRSEFAGLAILDCMVELLYVLISFFFVEGLRLFGVVVNTTLRHNSWFFFVDLLLKIGS